MTWASRSKAIKLGDRVAYSAAFCRNTGQISGEIPFARGIVTELKELSPQCILATIDWGGNPEIPTRVNIANLVRCGERGFSRD